MYFCCSLSRDSCRRLLRHCRTAEQTGCHQLLPASQKLQLCAVHPEISKWRLPVPKPASFGSGGFQKVVKGWKWANIDLLCSSRQRPAAIRQFSRHMKSANPHLCHFWIENMSFCMVWVTNSLILVDFCYRAAMPQPLQPISGVCSIEKYSCVWRIAFTAILRWVDNVH